MLGPLCVAMAAFRVEEWAEGEPAPDLWGRLEGLVSKKPERAAKGRGAAAFQRLAINDSKKLKLANSTATRDPLVHLERGVLTMLCCAQAADENAETPWLEGGDLGYFGRVGIAIGHKDHPAKSNQLCQSWYAGEAMACPRECNVSQLLIGANVVRRGLSDQGVEVGQVVCRVMDEDEFNEVVEAERTKAAATERALAEHLRRVWREIVPTALVNGRTDSIRVVCDRQGGRTQYRGLIERALGHDGVEVHVLEESPARSRYEVFSTAQSKDAGDEPARMVIMFMPEAEQAHLPVALASMTAKLSRELLMARMNRYWQARIPELKPTAGYRQDGWRWLTDLGAAATDADRRAMIRRA